MDVLRPLALRELLLRPREREVEPAVERLLRRSHAVVFGTRDRVLAAPEPPPGAYAVVPPSATLKPIRGTAALTASKASSRAIRSAIGGWVERSRAIPPPDSGFTI